MAGLQTATMRKNIDTFQNEPFLNFGNPENKRQMKDALASIQKELGKTYPLIINGHHFYTETDPLITSYNPGNKDEVVGYVHTTDIANAERAHHAAQLAFEKWKVVPADERAFYLTKAADIIRARKFEFAGWLIIESGKNWREADADVAEAIDFLEYYARSMYDLASPHKLSSVNHNIDNDVYTPFSPEASALTYIPLGVGVCLPPWNFPLAILVGMTAAAIVTGNTVVLKPSEKTSVIAYKFMEILEEIGLPPGVVNYIPGYGHEIGDYLVDHPQTRFISFTGSKAVGLRIFERASKTQPGQKWMKRVVAEMGGKDGVVVDETADLDRAARDIVVSAFGFQGQKCSAGSRAIIVESVYEEVKEKVLALTKELRVGLPSDNYEIGPVCDDIAYERVLNYIEIGKQEGALLLGGHPVDGKKQKHSGESEQEEVVKGYYIAPTVFEKIEPQHTLFQEEIFGPLLTLTKAEDWEEAINFFNQTEYGLTGAFHSSDEHRIQHAYHYMHCGNLYINKKCTGALVGVHPFGGFNMSGTDSKAGGPDYLLHFTQAKSIARLID